jgi:hypothetical protein
LLVYEPVLVDVRRCLANTRVGWVDSGLLNRHGWRSFERRRYARDRQRRALRH